MLLKKPLVSDQYSVLTDIQIQVLESLSKYILRILVRL